MGTGGGMKPFDELTQRGKSARLLSLAEAAVRAYPIAAPRVRLLAKHTNVLYRVDAADGARYLLRVCAPGEHSLRDHQIEALWLESLAHEADIAAPRLVANHDGLLITQMAIVGIPDGRRCMVFTWVPGRSMHETANIENYEKLGTLMARLHQHAAAMIVPEDMRPMRWDKAFYFPSDPVVVYDTAKAGVFPLGWFETIRQAEHIVNAELAKLFAFARPQLIHGDLHANNVHVYKGELYALDFEDVIWGFPAQDIAVTLYDARKHRDDYADVRDALQRGYERVAAWPVESDRQLETLLAARMLMFINYDVHRGGVEGVDMSKYLPGMLARVEAFVHNKVLS
jgi:Ser/Thr protein kinase RdoA (MazF antagonist)